MPSRHEPELAEDAPFPQPASFLSTYAGIFLSQHFMVATDAAH